MSKVYKHQVLIVLKGKGIKKAGIEAYANMYVKSKKKTTIRSLVYFKKWSKHACAIVEIDSGNSILHPPKPMPVPGPPINPVLMLSLNNLVVLHFGLIRIMR